MTFPAGLTTITVTGQNLLGLDGSPLSGDIIFTPSGVITAVPAVALVLEGSAVAQVSAGSITQPFVIATTDCVSPGFTYTVTFRLQTPDGNPAGLAPVEDVAIPSTLGDSIDVSALLPGSPAPDSTAFNSDNTWTGVQTFGGSPPLIIPDGAAAGDVLTSDADGHASWQAPTGGGGGGGISPPAGDLGGNASVPTVTATHLASPLPVAQGGTGQATQQAALDALAGAHTSGQVLRGNGTHVVLSALQAGDIPALAYDASGAAAAAQSAAEAASVPVGDLPLSFANGGTGQATQQAALDALVAAVTAGQVLRGNGTHVTLAALQAADVPTLNQSTTGNAATATNLAGGATLPDYLAPKVTALTFVGSGTTLVDASLGNAFNLTLTASTTTLGAPSNPVDGQVIRVRVTQGTGGSFTLAYASAYDFGAGSAPTLSTAAGQVDILGFEYVASIGKWCCLGAGLGYG